MSEDPTRGDHLLYLVHELDRALERSEPAWTPARANTVRLHLTKLVSSLHKLAAELSVQ